MNFLVSRLSLYYLLEFLAEWTTILAPVAAHSPLRQMDDYHHRRLKGVGEKAGEDGYYEYTLAMDCVCMYYLKDK